MWLRGVWLSGYFYNEEHLENPLFITNENGNAGWLDLDSMTFIDK
jgi:hypothetical protein